MVTYDKSDLENWLKVRGMSTNEFVKMIGCSRPVVWKVKRGIPICPRYADKIKEVTQGEIKPSFNFIGRS